jgi:hypothetical protein
MLKRDRISIAQAQSCISATTPLLYLLHPSDHWGFNKIDSATALSSIVGRMPPPPSCAEKQPSCVKYRIEVITDRKETNFAKLAHIRAKTGFLLFAIEIIHIPSILDNISTQFMDSAAPWSARSTKE